MERQQFKKFCEKVKRNNEIEYICDNDLFLLLDYDTQKSFFMDITKDDEWKEIGDEKMFLILEERFTQSNTKEFYFLCMFILANWKQETKRFLERKNYFNHIEKSLAHPDLKIEAKQTAMEILHSWEEKNNDVEISDSLKEIATQIVENDIYPEWEISNS